MIKARYLKALNRKYIVAFRKKIMFLFVASFACEIQEWADSVNSGQSLPGRILVVFVWLCNLMSMASDLLQSYSAI